MDNSSYSAPTRNDTRFLTSKKDAAFHGWGLLSVENTVKKYGGTLKCDFDKESFSTVVNLFFDEISG